MSRSICIVGMFLFAVVLMSMGCDLGREPAQPLPNAVQPVAPQLAQVPVPAAPIVAPPPPTPLIPIEPTPVTTSGGGGGGGGGGIDAAIGGSTTDGSELLGNYGCTFKAKGLPIGPFQLPPFGCKIYKAGNGSLKIGPTGRSGSANIHGSIKNPTDRGFFISGKYTFPGNTISVKARMIKKPAAKPRYSGKGRSILNDANKTKVTYTLIMNKK